MKQLNKQFIAVLLVVFVVLGLIMAVPAVFNSDNEYKKAVTDGDAFFEKNLCEKALQAYFYAEKIESNLDLSLKIAAAYTSGMENGEINSYYAVSKYMFSLIDKFKEEPKAYEKAIDFFMSQEEYEDCAEVLHQADDFRLSSKKIDSTRKELGKKFSVRHSMYQFVTRSSEGTYIVGADKMKVLNADLTSTIPGSYDFISPFTEGFALIKTEEYTYLVSSKGVREAYFDNTLTDATGVGCGMIACKIGDTYSYYNIKGEKLFGDYLFAGRFVNDVAPVQTTEGWQLIDKEGKIVANKVFEEIKMSPSFDCAYAGVIIAKDNGKYSIYNLKLEKISDFSCDEIDVFISDKSWAAYKTGDLWGYVDVNGNVQIEPKFEEAKSFSNGYAAVRVKDIWVFVNTKGKTVIKGKFSDAGYFDANGICFVKEDLYWKPLSIYYVPKKGEI